MGRDGGLEGRVVAEGNDLEARREGAVMPVGIRVGGESDDAQGAAMEIIGADDDLGPVLRHAAHFVAPFAHRLDGGFHRLGPAVHGQDLVRAGQAGEVFVEGRHLVVAEGARGQRELLRLFRHGGQDGRVAVALVDGRIGRQAVEVAAAVHVVEPDAAAARDHDVQRMVVVRAQLVFDHVAVGCQYGAHAVLPRSYCCHLSAPGRSLDCHCMTKAFAGRGRRLLHNSACAGFLPGRFSCCCND